MIRTEEYVSLLKTFNKNVNWPMMLDLFNEVRLDLTLEELYYPIVHTKIATLLFSSDTVDWPERMAFLDAVIEHITSLDLTANASMFSFSPLHLAIMAGNTVVIEKLFKAGATYNYLPPKILAMNSINVLVETVCYFEMHLSSITPMQAYFLMYAPDMLKHMLEDGDCCQFMDTLICGEAPLHRIAHYPPLPTIKKITKLLVEYGANLNLTSLDGTPMQIASNNGMHEMCNFLETFRL